jgi:hypothetical protein
MGCTTGGARIHCHADGGGERMLYFKTLDWGMVGLRKPMQRLEYVKDGKHMGCIGFIGILTGVKKGPPLSLNFRPTAITCPFSPM